MVMLCMAPLLKIARHASKSRDAARYRGFSFAWGDLLNGGGDLRGLDDRHGLEPRGLVGAVCEHYGGHKPARERENAIETIHTPGHHPPYAQGEEDCRCQDDKQAGKAHYSIG
jgi:hypothetical protein